MEGIFIQHHFSMIPYQNMQGTDCTVLCPNKQLGCREKKSEFYGRLQAVGDQKAKKDLLIMIGDFNATFEKDNIGKELVMGKEGLGEINENG